MVATKNTRNNSVGYLLLILSAPRYGAIGAFRNPAPTPELVQKHIRILFGNEHFLRLLGVERPEDAAHDWSALWALPNPFTVSAGARRRGKILLTDANRAIIQTGLTWFYENAPVSGGSESLKAWIPSQLAQPEQLSFAKAWEDFMKEIHKIIVKSVDEHLTLNNTHPDQIAQESDGMFSDGQAILNDSLFRATIMSHFARGAYGDELIVYRAGLATIQPWGSLGMNSIFAGHAHRWQRRLDSLKKGHEKATFAATAAWDGMVDFCLSLVTQLTPLVNSLP